MFITELENPYALTGYNLHAMGLCRPLLRRFLLSSRCREIRCLSRACRKTLDAVLGADIGERARISYPRIPPSTSSSPDGTGENVRFLFVGSQFELKGGPALVRAFRKARALVPRVSLDLVTHLPSKYESLLSAANRVRLYDATLRREDLFERFLSKADVLVHPTYVESFGMVVLEALAHGLAIIATDVYALPEMVEDGVNGKLLRAPVSIWDGFVPSPDYYRLPQLGQRLETRDTSGFEQELTKAIVGLASNREHLRACRHNSIALFKQRFSTIGAV